MKTKKLLFAAAFAAVTLLSGYNYVQNNSEVKLSDLALANVEALAGSINPDCINGCVEGLRGCYCFESYSYYSEANWNDRPGSIIDRH